MLLGGSGYECREHLGQLLAGGAGQGPRELGGTQVLLLCRTGFVCRAAVGTDPGVLEGAQHPRPCCCGGSAPLPLLFRLAVPGYRTRVLALQSPCVLLHLKSAPEEGLALPHSSK